MKSLLLMIYGIGIGMVSCMLYMLYHARSWTVSHESIKPIHADFRTNQEIVTITKPPVTEKPISFYEDYDSNSIQCEMDGLPQLRGRVEQFYPSFQNIEKCMSAYRSDQFPPYTNFLEFLESSEQVFQYSQRGINWYYLRDVCYDPSDNSLLLVDGDEAELSHFPSLAEMFTMKTIARSNVPKSALFLSNQSTWFWFPSSHVEDLMQQLFLLHSITTHPEFFPPMNSVFTDQASDPLISYITSLFVSELRLNGIQVMLKSDVSTPLCFGFLGVLEKETLSGSSALFSIFNSFMFRMHFYKQYPTKKAYHLQRITLAYVSQFAPNHPQASISREAIRYLHDEFKSITFTPSNLSSKKPIDLIEFLMGVDILMAASGDALSLSVFMLPSSGVVEIMPFNYRSVYYQKVAANFNLYYLSHTNFSEPMILPEGCAYLEGAEDIRELPVHCRRSLETGEVIVPPITLWMMITDMSKSVLHNKYHVYQYVVCSKKECTHNVI